MGKKEQFDEKAFTEFKQKIDLIHSRNIYFAKKILKLEYLNLLKL